MQKPLTSSPSFHELFDEDGNIVIQEADGHILHDQDNESTSTTNSHYNTNDTNDDTEDSASADLEREMTLISVDSDELLQESIRCGAPPSMCCGNLALHRPPSSSSRPSSSYSKTRSEYNAESTTPQLNLTPGGPEKYHNTQLESLDTTGTCTTEALMVGYDSRSPDNMGTTTATSTTMNTRRNTTPKSMSNSNPNTSSLRTQTPLEANENETETENLSPATSMQQSSFFLPETPPAPQARHDVLEDKEPISQLSLQPHIGPCGNGHGHIHGHIHGHPTTTSPPLPLSFMPTLRPPSQSSTSTNISTRRTLSSPLSSPLSQPPSSSSSSSSPLLFSSVPLDTLHSIAGYLTVDEWCNLSLVSKEAHLVCREIFKKMKMHGFKCAVEVISAWELGEHGDAKELAALYLKSGVPIYPAPFGHEYHTINWRMKMEATRINPSSATANESNNGNGNVNETGDNDDTGIEVNVNNHTNDTNDNPNQNQTSLSSSASLSSQDSEEQSMDRFYTERIDARTHEYNNRLTYLEEKGIFWRNIHYTAHGIIPEHTRPTPQRPHRVNIRPIPPPLLPGFGFFALFDEDDEDANFNHILEQGRIVGIGENVVVEPGNEHLPHIEFGHVTQQQQQQRNHEDHLNDITRQTSHQRRLFENQSQSRSASVKMKGIRVPVMCHRHLIDQHRQRHAGVNDERGTMVGSSLSLSADFFHSVGQRQSQQHGMLDLTENSVVSLLDLKVYSFESEYLHGHNSSNLHVSSIKGGEKRSDSWKSLGEMVHTYEKRLLSFLERTDYENFDECLLDFWDEIFTVTATVHFYDKFSPVPRMSYERQFLSQPCPKAFGTVQCEIERIKVYHKHRGVGVTGRLFPTYEYRLIVRDRRRIPQFDVPVGGEEAHPRLDTLLMTAKHRGRNYTYSSHSNKSSNRRGVNNYHFYMPQQEDIDDHLESVNESLNMKNLTKGFRQREVPGSEIELGRLQSNFIGTEFQIFSPNNVINSTPVTGIDDPTLENNQLSFDTNMSPSQGASGWRKKSKKLLRFPKSFRRQSDESDVNGEHRSRKGRISPWNSFSKKKVVAGTEQSCITDKEIGAITYTANLLGNRPRVMDVCIPKIHNETGLSIPFEPNVENGEESTILSNLKTLANQQPQNPNQEDEEDDAITTNIDNVGLLSLQNRPPWWNVELGAFVLNFGGRVSVASVKNFQLCDRHDHENIMLQFGRIEGRHYFTMDFSYPLSPLQAFAIAVSSLQSKISFA